MKHATAAVTSAAIADDPVVLIDELARLLKTSVRTISRQRRAGTFYIPEMPRLDRKPRWARAVVLQAIADGHLVVRDRRGLKAVR